jgi:anti-anti-sigma regulatory factor
VFRTELPRNDLARTGLDAAALDVTPLDAAPLDAAAGPRLAARGGRVISPYGPQPSQLGDEPPLYDDGVLRVTRIPGQASGYALAGEIDEAAFAALAGRLGEIVAELDEVHLNLAGLEYSDLAGLRIIVGLAATGRRRVVLWQVPPHLRAILAIVGWDMVPGLEIAS